MDVVSESDSKPTLGLPWNWRSTADELGNELGIGLAFFTMAPVSTDELEWRARLGGWPLTDVEDFRLLVVPMEDG